MLEIYLVRHGLTPWNKERRFQGSQDIPLAKEGIEQAEKVSERLQYLHFDAIYSSDLKRAFMTAEIIAKPHNISVNPVSGLREIRMGEWEGKLWDELKEYYPEEIRLWKEVPTQLQIPGSEGVTGAGERVYKAFLELASKHQNDQRILLVSHGLVIATILCQVEGISLDDWYSRNQGNTAVNVIEYDGEEFSPVLINCTRHFEE